MLLETSSDWPPHVQPNTLLALQSQSVSDTTELVNRLTVSESSDLALLLRINQLTAQQQSNSYSSKNIKLQTVVNLIGKKRKPETGTN